jgi:hypothetical protein
MERLFSTIPSVLSATASDEVTVEALVFAAWKNVAGEALNRRTRAKTFSGRKLTVAVNDAVWQKNLEDLAPGFVARVNRIAGEGTVRFIKFVIDPFAVDGDPLDRKTAERDFDLSASLIDSANAITDERLRENFLATAADYLARQKTDFP